MTDAERARIAYIRKLAQRAALPDAWAQALIDAGTSVEDVRFSAFGCRGH